LGCLFWFLYASQFCHLKRIFLNEVIMNWIDHESFY